LAFITRILDKICSFASVVHSAFCGLVLVEESIKYESSDTSESELYPLSQWTGFHFNDIFCQQQDVCSNTGSTVLYISSSLCRDRL